MATPNEWWLIEGWCPHCGHLIRCGAHGDRTESACLETPAPRTYHKSRHDLFMKRLVDRCLKQRERAFLLPIRTPASDTRQTQDSEEVPNATPTFMAARGKRDRPTRREATARKAGCLRRTPFNAPVVKKGSGAIIPLTPVLTCAIYVVGFHEGGRPDA